MFATAIMLPSLKHPHNDDPPRSKQYAQPNGQSIAMASSCALASVHNMVTTLMANRPIITRFNMTSSFLRVIAHGLHLQSSEDFLIAITHLLRQCLLLTEKALLKIDRS